MEHAPLQVKVPPQELQLAPRFAGCVVEHDPLQVTVPPHELQLAPRFQNRSLEHQKSEATAAGQLDAVRTDITSEWLAQVDSSMKVRPVDLSLPRFSFRWGTTSLKPALEGMGMTSAFSETADFSGMNADNELYIGDVLQQAFIGVDEAGTEAAAATAVIVLGNGMPEDPATFTADRPFVFFIRDASGSVLFSGQVTDPTK